MSTIASEPGRKHPTPSPYLYSRGRPHCDVRYCRTHALLAELFASPVANPHNAAAWAYISQAWAALADIKQRAVDEPGWRTLRVRSGVLASAPAVTRRPEPTVEGVQHGHDQGQGQEMAQGEVVTHGQTLGRHARADNAGFGLIPRTG